MLRGMRRALVLSLAYAHGSPAIRGNDEHAQVKYAPTEIDRCAKDPILRRGLKMQFANSDVDLQKTAHVEQSRRVFSAANTRRLAVVAHV